MACCNLKKKRFLGFFFLIGASVTSVVRMFHICRNETHKVLSMYGYSLKFSSVAYKVKRFVTEMNEYIRRMLYETREYHLE